MIDGPQLEARRMDNDGEAGYMLLAVVVMVALVLIALSVAAPVVAKDLRRDKEVESEHRAEQYVRAIRLYYRITKSYPPSMEALGKTNNVRYLRQKYIDPLTGKSDWRIIHQPKTKTHFPFGEELSGLSAGLGSAAGLAGGVGGGIGGNQSTGTSLNTGCSGANSAFCNQGITTSTSGGPGTTTGANGSTGSTSSSGDTGMFGDSNGGVIYGVGPARTGDSILTPNQQTTYETWEFWYDPLIEALYAKGVPTGGGGMGSQSASSFGQNAVTGLSNGSTPGTNPSTNSFGSGTNPSTNGFGSSGPGGNGSGGTASPPNQPGGFGSSPFP